ncbi:hypothetical protein PACTADRAFT_4931 [Pachysolen tannophilus NRRL Y-2460]|uniref:Uncharacterized protein n=1 Tax=Pachysolen tannophilus NRRL Y-2460 TaxID=669874 RepID=A0A1E4TN20_PACTA|nr:hypothetical protein PACTADRAFT_4931 [Pachysolen tannophilus NRRL Y-2460]
MFRRSQKFVSTFKRSYATESNSDAFLKDLLTRVQAIKTQSQQQQPVKKFASNKKLPGARQNNKGNNGNKNFKRFDKKNTSLNRESRASNQQQDSSQYANSQSQQPQQRPRKFNKDSQIGEGFTDVMDSFNAKKNNDQSRPRKSFNSNRKNLQDTPRTSRFINKKVTQKPKRSLTPRLNTSMKVSEKRQDVTKVAGSYSPSVPSLGSLIKYSPRLSYDANSRVVRATLQLLENKNVFLTKDKPSIFPVEYSKIPQVKLSPYPYKEIKYNDPRFKFSHLKNVSNVEFNDEEVNEIFNNTVFGKLNDLKIDNSAFSSDKLLLNAQVVKNQLNSNIFYNVAGRKERIVKSLTGLEPVKNLVE